MSNFVYRKYRKYRKFDRAGISGILGISGSQFQTSLSRTNPVYRRLQCAHTKEPQVAFLGSTDPVGGADFYTFSVK
jgi:hypothetical protein